MGSLSPMDSLTKLGSVGAAGGASGAGASGAGASGTGASVGGAAGAGAAEVGATGEVVSSDSVGLERVAGAIMIGD
ncbi:unnamed protein product [[Candida] boidinii]|uniref:Unnamed protein product n=1 Tax=Candida boidinii TaxID=5477 RepID=A0A9W6WLP8_CANBO|nr:unnamed protein product [[Candida] boidinii]GMF93375.1 unnamed protein product [[Candida] boidinii]GMF97478.1 unnamed protein product [[Candida] boidinii]